MPSTKLIDWIPLSKSRTIRNDYLLSRRQFLMALRRERLRSDRSLDRFSLLTIEPGNSIHRKRVRQLASAILQRRIRATDLAGWFKGRSIGVILPYTEADGAWKLAEDLGRRFAEHGLKPRFSVFVYPTFDEGDPSLTVPSQPAEEVSTAPLALPLHVHFAQKLPLWKRAIDIVGASAGLILVGPLMIMVAIAIKLTSPGPVLFKQRRDTIGGRPFTIYKFRTMVVDAEQQKARLRQFSEQDGPAFKLTRDPRITKIGRLLRVTSIDELPQLFNVLAGSLTLVGPRAMDSKESRQCEPWQRRRLDVTAGLTGVWQVHGRSSVSFAEWMRMDLEYIQSRSVKTDLKLIAQTVPAVLLRRGAC